MSATFTGNVVPESFDYSFRVVKVKRGTDNTAANITYTALPLEVRFTLERAWKEAHDLTHWLPLELRLQSDVAVPAEQLRAIAREMLADVASVWQSTAAEIAVIIRNTMTVSGPKLVERGQVVKSDARKSRERIARKLGKGVRHSRYGITLEGQYNRWPTWEIADRYVRGMLTDEELRSVRVQWERLEWDHYDNTTRKVHTVYADAEHLLEVGGHKKVNGTAWQAVRHTLAPEIAELVEALAGEWHGTGAELLEAALSLEVTNV